MIRSTNSTNQSAPRNGSGWKQPAKDAADFLKSNSPIAALLPAVNRMAALQRDCAAALPAIFQSSSVIEFAEGRLTLSVPNSSLAAKLKQQLPKLQDHLIGQGWQVNVIRLKLQISAASPALRKRSPTPLSANALDAFSTLENQLSSSPRNAALKDALQALLNKRRDKG